MTTIGCFILVKGIIRFSILFLISYCCKNGMKYMNGIKCEEIANNEFMRFCVEKINQGRR